MSHHHKHGHSTSSATPSSSGGATSATTASGSAPATSATSAPAAGSASKPAAAATAAPALDPSKDVSKMLSAEQLTTLRGGFSGQAFADGPRVSLGSEYPPVLEWLGPFLDRFFIQNVLPADRREQVILSVLAGKTLPDAYLGIHIYGALMEGLSPDDVANTLLLATSYQGLGNFNNAITIMGKTLAALAQCANTGVTETNTVVGAVAKALS